MVLKMTIQANHQGTYKIQIKQNRKRGWIDYSPQNKTLTVYEKGDLAGLLEKRKTQLQRILNNKKGHTFYVGFKLKFILQEKLPDESSFNKKLITVVDKTGKTPRVHKQTHATPGITQVITDGSFNPGNNQGGYSLMLRFTQKETFVKSFRIDQHSSNLIELIAVIKGLKQISADKHVLVTTDSQYVIKGISKWIYHWRLNHWRTANAQKVKHKKYWKQLDRLTNNKIIEFQWVKAHARHPENNLCDHMAKQATK